MIVVMAHLDGLHAYLLDEHAFLDLLKRHDEEWLGLP